MSHTGANGDTNPSFLGSTQRVDHETDPGTTFNKNEMTQSANETMDKGRATMETAFGSGEGAKWRMPEGRGAAGDFDDWNPRGESGTGGTPGPREPSLSERALGTVEKATGHLTNNADLVDRGESMKEGL